MVEGNQPTKKWAAKDFTKISTFTQISLKKSHFFFPSQKAGRFGTKFLRSLGQQKTSKQRLEESDDLLKKNYFTSSDPHHDMLGGGCQVRVVRKTSKPGMFFFTIFACSCRVLSATQNSTCQKCSSKQDTTICQNMSVYHLAERNMPKHATTNMPNHVRIPPVKNI